LFEVPVRRSWGALADLEPTLGRQPVEGGDRRKFYAVLHLDGVRSSPLNAVGAAARRLLTAAVLIACGVGAANAEERRWILEIGPASEWPTNGDAPNYGGTIALEREVIERWLAVEIGMTGLATSGQGELSWDILFKKPFSLTSTVELELGIGPEYSRPLPNDPPRLNLEFSLEFMVWSSPKIGWFAEPTFSVNPGTGLSSFGATGGLLIAL